MGSLLSTRGCLEEDAVGGKGALNPEDDPVAEAGLLTWVEEDGLDLGLIL